jgi:hypothetical protein
MPLVKLKFESSSRNKLQRLSKPSFDVITPVNNHQRGKTYMESRNNSNNALTPSQVKNRASLPRNLVNF